MADQSIMLSLAGLPVRILDDAPALPEWLQARCAPFHLQHDSAPDAAVTVSIRRDPQLTPGEDTLLTAPGAQPGGFRMHGIDFLAVRRRCGLPFEVEAAPEAGIAGLLRWVLGVALLEQGGLLVHAASCALDGHGILLAGPSGAGKTTISRLIQPQVTLFTDETTALRFEGAMPLIHATPFAGELGPVSGPASAPLELLCFLRHAPEFQARPLAAAEAAARLMGCLFLPLRHQPWLASSMALVEQVAQGVPCVELSFRPEPEVVEHLRGLLNHSSTSA